MDTGTAKLLLDRTLERAAALVGDITPPAIGRFYDQFPEARATFEALSPGRRAVLEAEMVDRTLYCLMTWRESPGEIEIMFFGSVPHHAQTLQVPPAWYAGLLRAVADVIGETIPIDARDEEVAWSRQRDELLAVVEESANGI